MAGNIAAGAARLALPATAAITGAAAYFGSTVPAGAGDDEFARQAKYGVKPTPASGRTGAGMNKTMNRVSSTVTSKPAAAPAPKPAAAPASAPAKSSFYKGGSQGDYTIKRGDTLSGIAKRTGQSVSDLASMNKISDVNKISSGAKLMTKVPTPPSRPADISKPTEPAAAKPYKPASPQTDRGYDFPVGPGKRAPIVGKTTDPSVTDTEVKKSTTSDYTSKVSQDFNAVRPQSSPQSSSPAPEPAKPAAPAPDPKKKEAGAIPASPMAESVVTVGANKYRIV